MFTIRSANIEEGLSRSGRIYLCGDLKEANAVGHYKTAGYEIGISDYPEYTFEKAHIHSFNIEYNYVLEGAVKLFTLSDKKEHLFRKGDLFIIETDEPYVGKMLAGTRTIFSKVPGGDDKILVEMDEALLRWGEVWENEYCEGDRK